MTDLSKAKENPSLKDNKPVIFASYLKIRKEYEELAASKMNPKDKIEADKKRADVVITVNVDP